MGFREDVAKIQSQIATHPAENGQYVLYKDRIVWERSEMFEKIEEEFPLEGVSVSIESGANVHKRLTVTRGVMLGVFSLALPKTKGGESYLTIEGPEFFWSVEVPRKKRAKAQKFMAAVSNQARQA